MSTEWHFVANIITHVVVILSHIPQICFLTVDCGGCTTTQNLQASTSLNSTPAILPAKLIACTMRLVQMPYHSLDAYQLHDSRFGTVA